jgi:DegV family protein with EDD domain
MDYLVKGGRISRAKGLAAGVFDIKPILHFDENGYIMPYDKVRGNRAALKRLLEIMAKTGGDLANKIVGVNHSDCPDFGDYLSESIKERFGVNEVIVGEIGPVIGSHVGPGTYSVFFERK